MNIIKGKYLVVQHEGSPIASEGILEKIYDQIDVLCQSDIDCEIVAGTIPGPSKAHKILESIIPFWNDRTSWPSLHCYIDCKFIYVRRPSYFSRKFIKYLKHIKKRFPNIYILLEIPTYPYEKEYSIKAIGYLVKDIWNRRKLHYYIDNIVDLFGHNILFGIPAIQICNGTPVRSEFKRVPSGNTVDIKMVCAANFSFWHGLDRLIAGFAQYRNAGGKRALTLDIIGDGPAISNYRSQVIALHLEKEIRFLRPVKREQLFSDYSKYNLGVETLARHRTGSNVPNSSLKSRDYLNAGLPFFGEGEVDVLIGKQFPYYHRVPSNDDPIDLYEIIDFFDSVYSKYSEKTVIDNMHEFAYETVDVHVAYGSIVEAVRTHCAPQR